MPFPQSPEEAKKEATGQDSKSERRLRSTQSILPDKEIQANDVKEWKAT
jgi:hypothetical protein